MRPAYEKIFARCPAADFLGRDAELEAILSLARGEGSSERLVVLAAPRVGASELLRQAFDRLFLEQARVSPFYFSLKATDATAQGAAWRFAYEFLLQATAFSRRDAGIIISSPEIAEIAELAAPADVYWIDRMVRSARSLREGASFFRDLVSAPQRAAANGARPFVMIDDMHIASRLSGGELFLNELVDIFSRSLCPVVLSGLRRFLFGRVDGDIVDLDAFPFADASRFVEINAARSGVELNDQTRDLVAIQSGGNAGHMTALIGTAAANGADLANFDDVQRIYIDDIFGGSIGRYFDEVLHIAGGGIIKLLAENIRAPGGKLPVTYWQKHAKTSDIDALIGTLHNYEVINAGSGFVTTDAGNIVLHDYVHARMQLQLEGEPRALTVANALLQNMKRAPSLMARSYRRAAAIGLKELLESFDGRQVSPALVDYERFRNELKGADDEKLRKALKEDNLRLRLPQIVYAAHAATYYPPLGEICDRERAVIGVGFVDGARRSETAWLVAEIDSKLEAKRDLTEFWCDRLEMAAVACGFSQFTTWLIAPEGFAPDAIEALRERNAYGSSRRQVEILAESIQADRSRPAVETGDVYEFDVPMGTQGELSTALTVEEIGRRHKFSTKVINQLKTALIEACINAAEHSLSPDGNIHQKFTVDADKVTVTVTNRGVRLADKQNSPETANEGRRSWGLKLIKSLTDKVEIAETDDGTSITMVKKLGPTR
jgi:serine/threonine-protein kinase RsbW